MTSSSPVSSPPWRLGLGVQRPPLLYCCFYCCCYYYYLASRVWMEGEEVTEGENFIGEVGGVLTPCESLLSFLITFRCLFCFASFRFMSSCWLVSLRGTEKFNCVKLVKKVSTKKDFYFLQNSIFLSFWYFRCIATFKGIRRPRSQAQGRARDARR